MFVLNSDISIGRFKRVKPIEVKVEKSLYQIVQRAVIKLPINAKIKTKDAVDMPVVETAKQLNEGDAVKIDLGYNGALKNEFIGFISRINYTSPIEVECEGYSYVLRKRTYLQTFVKTQLRDILSFLIDGTGITLDKAAIPDFLIDKLVLSRQDGVEALQKVIKISEGVIRVFFIGKQMVAGLQFTKSLYDVKYKMGWNVIKDGGLKLRQATNRDVTIVFQGQKKDGTIETVTKNGHTVKKDKIVKTTAIAGTTGETKIYKSSAITDRDTLSKMSDAKHEQLTYDGYEGKITAFLQPYCEPACRVVLIDPKYPDRSGNYICTAVEVTYGNSGARRIVEIGHKL